jgi:hypothetical protein
MVDCEDLTAGQGFEGCRARIGRATPSEWKKSFEEWKTKYGHDAKKLELKALEIVRPGGGADDIERWRQLVGDRVARMPGIESPRHLAPPSEFRKKLKRAAAGLREVLSDRSGLWRVAHSDYHLAGPGLIPPSTIDTLKLACKLLDVWLSSMQGMHLPHDGGAKDLHIAEAAAEFAWELIDEHICTPVQSNNKSSEENPYYALAQLLARSVVPGIKTDNACRKLHRERLGRNRE